MSTEAELSELFLQKLNLAAAPLNSLDVAKAMNIDHQKMVGLVKSLQSLAGLIEAEQKELKQLQLSAEGKSVLANGAHEWLVWKAVPENGIEQPALLKSLPDANVAKLGFAKAMSNKWVAMDKSSGKPVIVRKVVDVVDEVKNMLALVEAGNYDQVCRCFVIFDFLTFPSETLAHRSAAYRAQEAQADNGGGGKVVQCAKGSEFRADHREAGD